MRSVVRRGGRAHEIVAFVRPLEARFLDPEKNGLDGGERQNGVGQDGRHDVRVKKRVARTNHEGGLVHPRSQHRERGQREHEDAGRDHRLEEGPEENDHDHRRSREIERVAKIEIDGHGSDHRMGETHRLEDKGARRKHHGGASPEPGSLVRPPTVDSKKNPGGDQVEGNRKQRNRDHASPQRRTQTW
jgi:hypothetical protein